jgi:hypothetical protein
MPGRQAQEPAAGRRRRHRDRPDRHPGGQQTIAYLVFALISTLGIGIPVAIYFAMGARSESSSSG